MLDKLLVNDLINQGFDPACFKFIDSNGLVNASPLETNGENSILWTVELFVLMKKQGYNTEVIQKVINNALDKMHLGNGRYKQNPSYANPSEGKEQTNYMSHDQMTAMITYWSITKQQDKIDEMVDYLTMFVSYDNVKEESLERVMHPRDLIYYHIMAGHYVAYLFIPLLYVITLYTMFTDTKERNGKVFKKTDGEILYYIKRESTFIFKPIDFLCNYAIKERFEQGWSGVFLRYFGNEGHPIRELFK